MIKHIRHLSDVGSEFLQNSIVTLSEHPQGAANIDADDDFNRICRDINLLVDEEGAANEYVEKNSMANLMVRS